MKVAIPALTWLRRYDSPWLRGDVVAGITLAAYLLPAALGDASLANLPPEAGLYACLFGGLVFWLFCSSRHTAITVTSAISLLVGASLGEIAGGDTARFTALASATALLVALIAFIAWLAKAGSIVNFISESVMVGFKCGVALFLASTQLPKLFGFKAGHGSFWESSAHFFKHLGDTNSTALTIGAMALALVKPAVHAGSSAKVRTVEELRSALQQDRFVPKAFTKGDQVRLYFSNAEQRLMFKADWDRARLRVQGFSSHVAELRFDASPPPIEPTQQKWREVKVLAYAKWHRFARSAAETLAPTEAGHGLYLQYALGDAVVFRNATGAIKVERLASLPDGISIDRRLSRQEATTVMAGIVETNLQAAHPGESVFLLAPPPDTQRSRLALLHLAERRVVVLLPPRTGDDLDGGGLSVGSKVLSLASFVILDNAWAILKNPVPSVGRALNLGVQWPASLFGPRLRNKGSDIPPVTSVSGIDLDAWENWLDTHTRTHRERGSLRLLINGEGFFPLFEDRLATASQRIDIHVCIFDRNDVAVEIAHRLKQQSPNVAVRVIYDHNSSKASGKSPPATPMPARFTPPESIHHYLTTDSHVGVRPFLNPFLTSDPSKVLLIDGRFAYLGGMNLGREYRYEWHDMMVEVDGPVVASLQHEFDKNWAHAGPLGDLAFANRAVCGKPPEPVLTNRNDFVDLRRIYTKTGRRQIWHAELEIIRRARNHIYLENPYLYDNAVIAALVNARLRGVDVRVVLPTGNDLSAGEGSNLVTANYLLRHGVRVYFYPGMTHVKALLTDGWACFSSANFNTLSLRLNQETNLATSDPGFAVRFRHELFDTDFVKSCELKEPISVSWSDHLADSILNQF